ncbi:hypothetical protein [Streptomyces alkaliterrae]|nr:hypothetical protein [Streptomyces alkaliterrae]MQS02990.1 hypothetical protein [Streptomyces alkaliterrae]
MVAVAAASAAFAVGAGGAAQAADGERASGPAPGLADLAADGLATAGGTGLSGATRYGGGMVGGATGAVGGAAGAAGALG